MNIQDEKFDVVVVGGGGSRPAAADRSGALRTQSGVARKESRKLGGTTIRSVGSVTSLVRRCIVAKEFTMIPPRRTSRIWR